jgi:hypothetical protein
MRKAFAALATLLLLIVIAQFFFAATGAFSTAPNDESFRMHHALGYVIFLVPVVMVVVAALARMPGQFIGMAALISGLTAVQVLIAVGPERSAKAPPLASSSSACTRLTAWPCWRWPG